MGRIATPTQAKINAGNPGGKGIRRDEPKPVLLEDVSPPKDFLFTPMAVKVWKILAPKLKAAKMVAETDTLPLAILCNDTAELLKASKQAAAYAEAGQWDRMGGGKGRAFSAVVSVRNAAHARFEQGAAKFGMTPADRTKLIAIDTQMDLFNEDADEEALNQEIAAAAAKLGVVIQFPQQQAQ